MILTFLMELAHNVVIRTAADHVWNLHKTCWSYSIYSFLQKVGTNSARLWFKHLSNHASIFRLFVLKKTWLSGDIKMQNS